MTDITCLICYYYHDDLIKFKLALNSIFNQINVSFEIILVVDGPIKEESMTYINSIRDKLNICWLEKNMGHGYARAKGLELSNSKYIAIFDSDDISSNTRLEKSFNYLNANKQTAVVSGIVREIWDNGLITYRNCFNLNFKYTSPVNQNCCMFRKDIYDSVGGYISWYHNEDTYLWVRFLKNGWNIGYINDILADVSINLKSLRRRRGYKYFISEVRLRYYMYDINMINFFELFTNIITRLLFQIILPFTIFKYIFIWNRKK